MQRRTFLITSAAASALTALPALAQDGEKLKVGFIYVGPVGDGGWSYQHDQGRQAIEAEYGDKIETTFIESVPEGADAERALTQLALAGNKLIFATSFGFMDAVMATAAKFPDVKFEHATGYKRADNVSTYDARFYEGRAVMGTIAGRMTKSNKIGYIGSFPIPEVIQGINAFALGMRSVNPQAQVKVVWINTWFDPPREREAAMTLFDQGVDVMAFHTASTAIMAAAQERGKLAVAYHSDMRSVGPDAQIVAATHQWGAYYTQRAKAVLNGSWKTGNVWGGVREGMIRMEGFGSKVPAAVQQEVLARQKDMAAGKLKPFAAGKQPVRDNQGAVRIAAGQALSDEQILPMNWLVEGVQGQLTR